MSASSSAHLSELTLFRLAGGELVRSTSEGDQAMAHLHDCSRCADDYGKLLGDVQAFAFRPGLPRLARQMQRRATRRRFGRHLALAASAAAVMAAVVIPVLVRRDRAISGVDARIRGKGGTKLQLFVKHRSGVVEAMLPNGTASPGDALRFWVDVPRDGYLGVVSVDGAGLVSPYVPAAGELRPVKTGPQLLDGAVELDDALGRERIEVFLCSERLQTEQLVSALRLARQEPRCSHTAFWFIKRPPP